MAIDLNDDPRWRRLHERDWTCPCCGWTFKGLPDIGIHKPAYWAGNDEIRPNWDVRSAPTILTEDFCVIDGKDFFIRGVLTLPIVGTATEQLGIGAWASSSRKNFDIYVDRFDDADSSDLEPWFGWFSNTFNGYPETLGLKCLLHPRNDGKRPVFELEATDHPLAVQQRVGITFEDILDWFANNGHDMRGALLD